jgi:hypothetical protein
MSTPAPAQGSIEDLTMGRGARLEELVDRQSLQDLAKSLADLSGVGLRVFDAEGKLLSDASLKPDLFEYLSSLLRIRTELENVVS